MRSTYPGSRFPGTHSKTVELRRHTDADGDVLTPEGIRTAVELGVGHQGEYDLLISSGAQRATQTLACLLAGMAAQQPCGVVVDPGFRSTVEDRWFEAAKQASGKDLEAFRRVDPDLVEKESQVLGAALRAVFDRLPEGGRALVVGHSPTTEAAVLGLTGQIVDPISKGAGVRVVIENGESRIEAL
jgi:broad specificity phosphatase PhoE